MQSHSCSVSLGCRRQVIKAELQISTNGVVASTGKPTCTVRLPNSRTNER